MMAAGDVIRTRGEVARRLGCSVRTLDNYYRRSRDLGIALPFLKIAPNSPIFVTEGDLFAWYRLMATSWRKRS